MRYAFVFLSIFSIWVATILMAAETAISATFLACVVLGMTVIMFLIGFQRGR